MPEQCPRPTIAQRIPRRIQWIALLWLVAAISVGAMAFSGPFAWDVYPSWTAIQSVGRGGSPYSVGIAALRIYHNLPSHATSDSAPAIFWYPPLTIPVLRLLSWLPVWLLGSLYLFALAVGFLLQLRAGYEMASEQERRWLIYLLPFAAFFPGLLCDQTILSGNVAFILYGLVLTAAVPGWKKNRWTWFYAAILFASIFKAPMLTLLAFPILVGRTQRLPATITGAAGCLLFGLQPLLWPAQFKEFLFAVHAVFDWSRDFGFGPSGLLGRLFWEMKKPYSAATTIAYLLWVIALGALLLVTKFHVRRHAPLRADWIPIAFVGTILLDPRIIFYDTAPLTIPLLLIAWRSLSLRCKQRTLA
ncbi:MAG: hypothetical protein ABR907_10480, partial [Terracidiphilus sp.]